LVGILHFFATSFNPNEWSMKKKSPQEGWGLNPRPLGPTSKTWLLLLPTWFAIRQTQTQKTLQSAIGILF
jgi:hypothetical protein